MSTSHFLSLHLQLISFQGFGLRKLEKKLGFIQNLSQSMSNSTCVSADEYSEGCRNESFALILKMVAIAAILIAGVCGVAIPLVGKKRRFLQTDSNLFVAAKAFAAGVILATGFVHMLPDATSALTNSCLPKLPWSKFPFSGFVAMIASLATLLVDFLGTQYYERKQENESPNVDFDSSDSVSELGIVPAEKKRGSAKVFGEEDSCARRDSIPWQITYFTSKLLLKMEGTMFYKMKES